MRPASLWRPTCRNQRRTTCGKARGQRGQHLGRHFKSGAPDRPPVSPHARAQPVRPRHSGVGGDQPVNLRGDGRVTDRVDRLQPKVGRKLDEERPLAAGIGKPRPAGRNQAAKIVGRLEIANPGYWATRCSA